MVARAQNLIETCFHEPLTLNGMSEKLHVSPYYLHRTVRRRTGQTPGRLLTNRRMEAERELLADTMITVQDIALKVGFKSAAHFCSVFRHETGLTTTEFRAVCRTSVEQKGG